MIVNHILITDISTVEGFLLYMNQNSEKYYLTGSRFFENNKEDSDWDFFVEKSVSLENRLRSLNFKEIEHPVLDTHYGSVDISLVLEKKFSNGVVQIQLINADEHMKLVELKNQIQNFLKRNCSIWFNSLEKKDRKAVWNILFERELSYQGQKISKIYQTPT